MSIATPISRTLEPGTTGWTVDDLADPVIERLWEEGAYEIVEGVLATMPPAYYDGSVALHSFMRMIESYLERSGILGRFAAEVDVVLKKNRIARPDAVFMTPEDERKQAEANARGGKRKLKYGRLSVPPTLIIEAVSMGHEAHDCETKLAWYAEAQVPNYWVLNPYLRTLECHVLEGGAYRLDVAGRENDQVKPALFPGLVLELGKVWA